MTLNITLVTPWAIHQSADFRLSLLDRGSTGRWMPVSNNSAKIVTLQYFDWGAFISYCGVGMWDRKHTYQWLAEWLTHEPGGEPTFEDTIGTIQSKGSDWLSEIARRARGRLQRHTFIVSGFVDDLARVALVSNFEHLDAGRLSTPAASLSVSTTATRHARLIITGIPDAVQERDRMFLEGLGKRLVEPDVVRYHLAQVNARAAASKEAQNGISSSCLAYSYLPDGSGAGECHGDVEGSLNPIMLMHGINLFDMIKINPAPGRKVQMRGFTMARSDPDQADTEEPVECSPEVVTPGSGHPRVDDLAVTELGSLSGYHCRPTAINDRGEVVGESHISPSGPPHAFRWTRQTGIQDLGTFDGPQSVAQYVNNEGAIVGSAQKWFSSDRAYNRAFLWTSERGMRDLGTLGGNDSAAKAINNLGHVIGSSYVTPGEPSQEGERAFLWTPDNLMIDLGTLAGGWSRAADINDKGQAIGDSPVGGFLHAFLWTERDGMLDLGTLGGDMASPVAINNRGHVLGVSETSSRERHAFLWTEDEGMVDLGLNPNYQPRGVNDHGEVIGTYRIGPRTRSFLWSEVTGLLNLPWFRDHHLEVTAINNRGGVVGWGWRDNYKHSHPILLSVTAVE